MTKVVILLLALGVLLMVDSNLPALRKDLKISRVVVGKEIGYVVKDPLNNEYFRFDANEWKIIALFDGQSTPGEAVEAFNNDKGNDFEIDLETLEDYRNNLEEMKLLFISKKELNLMLIEKIRADRKSQILSKKGSLMYKRFPLWDPDRFFNKIIPHIGFFWSKPFMVISSLTMIAAVIIVFWNYQEFLDSAHEVFSFSKMSIYHLLVLWFTIYIILAIHEIGHGLTCKYYGGEVHEIGFLLLFFQPCLYCNVNDAWLFDKKYKKVAVTLAGGYIEFFIGSLAAFVWILTNPASYIHILSFQVLTVCSASTVIMNMNPLIKLDGYYLLADSLGVANLRQTSFDYLKYLTKRYFFRLKEETFEGSTYERTVCLVYGCLTFCWVFSLMFGLFFMAQGFLSDNFGVIGILLSIMVAYKLFWGYVKSSGKFFMGFIMKKIGFIKSGKFKFLMLVLMGALLLGVFIPYPYMVSAPVGLEANSIYNIRAKIDGVIKSLKIRNGDFVKSGTIVAEMENFLVKKDRDIASESLKKASLKVRRAVGEEPHKYYATKRDLNIERLKYQEKDEAVENLLVTYNPKEANYINKPGRLSCKNEGKLVGSFIKKDEEICRVVDIDEVRAVLEITEYDIRYVQIGDRAEFKIRSVPLKSFNGYVKKIRKEPKPDPTNPNAKLYLAEIQIQNDGHLLPGMAGKARIIARQIPVYRHLFNILAKTLRLELFF